MVLSTLWIFATLNYLYGDVFTLFFIRGAQETTFAMPCGGRDGVRSTDGDRHCHGAPFPRAALRRQPLGEHRRRIDPYGACYLVNDR